MGTRLPGFELGELAGPEVTVELGGNSDGLNVGRRDVGNTTGAKLTGETEKEGADETCSTIGAGVTDGPVSGDLEGKRVGTELNPLTVGMVVLCNCGDSSVIGEGTAGASVDPAKEGTYEAGETGVG